MAMGLEPDVIYDLVQLKPCYDSVPWYQFRCFIYFWVVPYFYPYYSALGTNYFLVNIRILFISDHPILFFCPVISGKGWWTMSFSGWAGDEPFLLKCQDLEKKKNHDILTQIKHIWTVWNAFRSFGKTDFLSHAFVSKLKKGLRKPAFILIPIHGNTWSSICSSLSEIAWS